jgi:glycosyltransferase involved in cell wall biosynthesis
MVIKKVLYHLKRGKLMFIGKPLFIGLVNVELLYERLMDRLLFPYFEGQYVNENLTAVIKTFERPRELWRLIESIRRFYPGMNIIVVDDSKEPLNVKGVKNIVMPYDSGVSAGRNRALSEVKTPYFLLLDDDFIFYRKTDLLPALQKMHENANIDIMGGEVINLPLYTSTKYQKTALYPKSDSSVLPSRTLIDGMHVQDKVANFYVGRTESVRRVGWDERIKRLDHADFFTRAKGTLVTVFNGEFKVLHAQTPFNKNYMEKRNDYGDDKKLLYEKYYCDGGC